MILAITSEQSYNLEKCGRDKNADYGGTDLLKTFSNNRC
ncbi:conserved hypothetical protein [Listeria monocytogenes]|nr:conserved hypothetical protein [Listeria monocytogenes]CUL22193.1 conserved hypothetical protein [Listeria monocytogenes]